MSLQTRLTSLATRMGTEFKSIRTTLGGLASLSTTDKSSYTAAINEVRGMVGSAGATINDTTPSGSSVYSSSKTDTQITNARAALKAELLGGAGPTIDTLKEIADLLTASDVGDDAALAALTTAVGNRVRFDAAQTLTAPEKVQANANLGSLSLMQSGDPETDLVAAFEAALI